MATGVATTTLNALSNLTYYKDKLGQILSNPDDYENTKFMNEMLVNVSTHVGHLQLGYQRLNKIEFDSTFGLNNFAAQLNKTIGRG